MENLRSDWSEFLEYAKGFLKDPFVMIDVGCSGGIDEILKNFGDKITYYGFDSNIDEVKKLNSANKTVNIKYIEALIDFGNEKDDNGAKGENYFAFSSAAAGSEIKYKKVKDSHELMQQNNLWTKMDVSPNKTKIQDFIEKEKIEYIDFVKSDLDGYDFKFLKGLKDLYEKLKILSVVAEVSFASKENDEAEISCFLKQYDFLLHSLTTRHYSSKYLPDLFAYDIAAQTVSGRIVQGDALYVKNYISNSDKFDSSQLLKLAIIADLFNLPDCAAEIIINNKEKIAQTGIDIKKALNLLAKQRKFLGEISYDKFISEFYDNNEKFYPKSYAIKYLMSCLKERALIIGGFFNSLKKDECLENGHLQSASIKQEDFTENQKKCKKFCKIMEKIKKLFCKARDKSKRFLLKNKKWIIAILCVSVAAFCVDYTLDKTKRLYDSESVKSIKVRDALSFYKYNFRRIFDKKNFEEEYFTSNEEVKQFLLKEIPILRDKKATDYQKVTALRLWFTNNVPTCLTRTKNCINWRLASEKDFYKVFNYFSFKMGLLCGGQSRLFVSMVSLFGYKATSYNMQIQDGSHVVVLVKIKHKNKDMVVIQDVFMNNFVRYDNGELVDFFDLINRLNKYNIGDVKIEQSSKIFKLFYNPRVLGSNFGSCYIGFKKPIQMPCYFQARNDDFVNVVIKKMSSENARHNNYLYFFLRDNFGGYNNALELIK